MQPEQILSSIPSAEACVRHGSSFVTMLSLYPTPIPRVRRGWLLTVRLLLTRLLYSSAYQAIVVILPKLTNAPTKVHTECITLWGSGIRLLCRMHVFLLLAVLLFFADHYASSSTLTTLHT